jgi:hypothetical protein
MNLPYYYDQQLRRIIIQMIRVFSGFRYITGNNADGSQTFSTVPVVWGDGDRQAQHMLTDNSENVTLSVPRIAVSITGMKPAALTRGGWRGNINELQVAERAYNPSNQTYGTGVGNLYEVDRAAPNPIDIQFKIAIWTSNTEQKFQLFEQIYLLFNPDIILQPVSSPLDWTAIQTVTLDDISWEDNGANTGTDDTNDVMSFTCTAQSYISPPSRVKRLKVIQTIIQNIGDALADCDNEATWEDGSASQIVVTPGNFCVQVSDNSRLTLLGANQQTVDQNGNPYSWQHLLDDYGQINVNSSTISLRWVSDVGDDSLDIVGYITLDPTLDNVLDYVIQSATLPLSTQIPVLGVINPHTEVPGNGLPAANKGQRYILNTAIGGPTVAWGNLTANPNDIVQYDGANWNVVLDASTDTTLEFVQDTSTNQLLKLVNHAWTDAINGIYGPGYFRINL